MEDNKIVVCRLCLGVIQLEDSEIVDGVARNMLQTLNPKLILDITVDPKLCRSCNKAMLVSYEFKNKCQVKALHSEVKIENEAKTSNVKSEEISKSCHLCHGSINEKALTGSYERIENFTEIAEKSLGLNSLSSKTALCETCFDASQTYFTFVNTCLDTEQKIETYYVSNGTNSQGKINLYEALQFMSSSDTTKEFNESCGTVTVKLENDTETEFPPLKMEEIDIKCEEADLADNKPHVKPHKRLNTDPIQAAPSKQPTLTKKKVETRSIGVQVNVRDLVEHYNIKNLPYWFGIRIEEDNVRLSPPKKRHSKHLSVAEKTTVVNIFKSYQIAHPEKIKVETVHFTAEAAGISVTSVYKILKEYQANHQLAPPKVYHRPRAILDNVDDETKSSIRRKVHAFFLKNESPTVSKIQQAINEDYSIANFKKTTLKNLLPEIGFRFNKRNSMLTEKPEIIVWRRSYLREIKKIRQAGRKIYYLDEKCINTAVKSSTNTTTTTPKEALPKSSSKNPSGKFKQIILQIASADGFVEDEHLLFESKKAGDHNDDADAIVFERWFQKVLPRLEEGCVVVLNGASYHSRKVEKTPNANTEKAEIRSWLTRKGVHFEDDMVRAELLCLVKANKGRVKYAVDEMASESNRGILRLPPNHSELNPIKLIWARCKGEVGGTNDTVDVKMLLSQALRNVTRDIWKNAFGHVIKIEEKLWELDDILDIQEQASVNNLEDSDSDTSSSSEST